MSGFSFMSFVPPDEDHMVIEVDWDVDGVTHASAEVAHDPVHDKRSLTYWILDRSVSVPFFSFMEALAQANVIAHRGPMAPTPSTTVSDDLHVRFDDGGSVSLIGAGGLVVARVRVGMEEPALEIWEPDSSPASQVPLYQVMEGLFEASVRLDRYAKF